MKYVTHKTVIESVSDPHPERRFRKEDIFLPKNV
jgi:hypothetical protein